jgi:hypothetical protein
VRIGGAFGGAHLSGLSIIGNSVNVSIDNTLAAEANREVMFSNNVAIDGGEIGVRIDDSLGAQGHYVQFDGTWIASAKRNNVEIGSNVSYTIAFNGGRIYNAGENDVYNRSPTAVVYSIGTQFFHNGGYGFNSEIENHSINIVYPICAANILGAASPHAGNIVFVENGTLKFQNIKGKVTTMSPP